MNGFLAVARPVGHPAIVPPLEEAKTSLRPRSEATSFEEEIKRRLHPFDSFTRLLDCAAANRPPDEEDCFRFQWFGLFYQAPTQDAFVLRLRLPGGRLRPFQLAGLAEITQQFAGGQVVFNVRGGLDIPSVPVTSAGRILSEVERIGLSAWRAGGDCVQAVRGGEEDGTGPGVNGALVYRLICALEQALALGPAFADLPHPCEIVFQAAGETETVQDPTVDTLIFRAMSNEKLSPDEKSPFVEEDAFVLHLPHEAEEGFQLSARMVVPRCLSLLESWKFGADRSSRENARLTKFLRDVDPATLCATLGEAKRVSSRHIVSGSREQIPGYMVPGGRLLSGQLTTLEQQCREQGWREIRLRRGHLHPVGLDGRWVEATEILA